MESRERRGEFGLTGRRVGNYEILEPVGRGGMGEVYRARDRHLDREVAVKVLPPSLAAHDVSRRRFLRETRVACQVVHPYVATVFDVVEERGDLFLVMEYIEGRGLDEVLRADHPPLERVCEYAIEIGEALCAIHDVGLVHRDLKPGNVMVTPAGHVKVMDFGIARPDPHFDLDRTAQSTETMLETVTEKGGEVGTVQYMSPEQVRGRPVDRRSDLFSFGVLLYEAITGDHPFQRESLLATASAIMNDPPGGGTEPKTLTQSGPFRDIVLRLLEKERERRYQDAKTLVTDLKAALRGEGLTTRGWRRYALRKHVRTLLPVAAAAAVLAFASWYVATGRLASLFRTTSVPAAARSGLVVLPFRGGEGDAARLRGDMVASILRAGLAESGTLRVVGSTRTDELLGRMSSGGDPAGNVGRALLDAASARWLVTGRLDDEEGEILAAVEIFDVMDPDHAIGFRERAGTLSGLVDRVSGGVAGRLPSASAPAPFVSGVLAAIAEPALLAAERGRQAFDRGLLDDAARAYGEATEKDPTFVQAYVRRARILYDSGFVTRAREELARGEAEAARLGRPLPRRLALEVEAVRARVGEKREDEIAAMRKLAEANAKDPDAWADLGLAYRLANRSEEAIVAIDRAIAIGPSDPLYRLRKARCLSVRGLLDAAGKEIEEADRLDALIPARPLEARILLERGNLALKRKDFEASRGFSRRAAESFSRAGEPLFLADAERAIAQAYILEGNLADAVGPLERAVERFASAGNARQEGVSLDNLGAVYVQAGDFARAEATHRRALEKYRETQGDLHVASPLLNLANLMNLQARGDEARPFAEEALRIARAQGDEPRQASALCHLANTEAQAGRFEAAIGAYRRAIDLLGEETQPVAASLAWDAIASVEISRGRLGAARHAIDRAAGSIAQSGRSLEQRYLALRKARIALLLGERPTCDAWILKAASTPAPRLLDAHIALEKGLAALEAGTPQAARELLETAIRGPSPVDGLTSRALGANGIAFCRESRFDEGIGQARRAVDTARSLADRAVASNDLAFCLALGSRHEDARAAALTAFEGAQSAGMLWEEARAAASLVSLPPATRPAGEAGIRDRGRRAYDAFLRAAPEGSKEAVASRPDVRQVGEALGSSHSSGKTGTPAVTG